MSKSVYLKRITNGGLGAKPPAAVRFFAMFCTKTLFQCHWITLPTYSEKFEKNKFLTFESQLKK